MYLGNVAVVLGRVITSLGLLKPMDSNPNPYIFQTNSLPTQEREMTAVGNGHVATVVYSDTVYMNGLYTGYGGESHRARIPSRNNIRVTVHDQEGVGAVVTTKFELNVRHGVFIETFNTPTHSVQVSTFAHRYFHKVLVSQVHVTRIGSQPASITLNVSSFSGKPSVDLELEADVDLDIHLDNAIDTRCVRATSSCGHTIIPENPQYQQSNSTVCIITTKPPTFVTMDDATKEAWFTFYAAYDSTKEGAIEEFAAVTKYIATEGQGHQGLYDSHVTAWKLLWNDARIEIGGNVELAKTVNGALYHILSSLPVTTKTNSPTGPFFGLSPSGLAYGSLLKDYQGHSFWDTEMWMFPVILNFFPDIARDLLNYRVRNFPRAKDYANSTGNEGARYPWESGFTGADVTPDFCPHPRDLQIHISADISFAVKQYFASTFDVDWMKTDGGKDKNTSPCDMVRAIAQFWVSRATFNPATNKYDINQVMPPDEDNYPVNNSIYTNVIAADSVFFSKHIEHFCGDRIQPIPKTWLDFAQSLEFVFDPVLNYHPEFKGYKAGTQIKQGDVVLLGYPLQYDMSPTTRRNDLAIYEKVTRSSGPAMTWAIHAINHLELSESDKAEELFKRSYQPYLLEPFKTWSEQPGPNYGASNFLTGMGGFLQAIVNGYGGLRIHSDKLLFIHPNLPPNSTTLHLIGIKYLGSSLNILVDSDEVRIVATKTNDNIPLTLDVLGEKYPLTNGKEMSVECSNVTQFTIQGLNVHIPVYPK